MASYTQGMLTISSPGDKLESLFTDLEELIVLRQDLPDASAAKLDKTLEATLQEVKVILDTLYQLAHNQEHLDRFKVIRKDLLTLGAVFSVTDEICNALVDKLLDAKAVEYHDTGIGWRFNQGARRVCYPLRYLQAYNRIYGENAFGYRSDPPRAQFVFLWSLDRTSFSFKVESHRDLSPDQLMSVWLRSPFFPFVVRGLRSYDNDRLELDLDSGVNLVMEFYSRDDMMELAKELEQFYGIACE